MPRILGIPNREYYGDISKLRPGDIVDLIVQEHKAERAGKHYDIRIGSPKTNLLSWASRKWLPEPGEKRMIIRQPLHTYEYGGFEGEIPSGYGKGTVRKALSGKIVITDVSPERIIFATADERYPERFALIAGPGKRWFLANITPTEYPEYEKPKFVSVPASAVDHFIEKMREGDTLQEKIDGAHGLIKLLDRSVDVLSYRKSVTGRPIVHTERVFRGVRPQVDVPAGLRQSLLAGEIYGVSGEKVIPPQQLGGILNSAIMRALESQRKGDVRLRVALFDIAKLGKKELSDLPYQERMRILRETILPLLPKDVFETVVEAKTPEEAKQLWQKIREGKYPRTEEGVIMRPAEGKPMKAKLMEEEEVYIRRIFPGEGKYSGNAAGGFEYSLTPDGKIVGKVGTGFSDEMRRMLWERQNEMIGRAARIKYQGKPFESGARRMPVFIALHEGV